ncbi:hypothetical protein FU090_08625 [Campylobacter jejuni]|nr:hypothetical protein [Campylobacter jejuni]
MWLSLWPLASDDLHAGVYRCSRGEAMHRRFIETNPRALSNLLVVDIDHEDAALRTLWNRQAWWPNAVVENPANGHAHAVWALNEPITRTEYARRKPLAFAAAVTEGLRRSVDGDTGYSGLLTKNPAHADWDALWCNSDWLYGLDELAEHLTEAGYMPPPSWKRTKRRNQVGLGRNCSIFETARTWAYREIRHHWFDSAGLHDAISAHVNELNAEFPEPLPASEARAIAASIHRWITTKSRMWADGPAVYEATFSTIQAARGRKGGERRASNVRQRISEEMA